MRISSILAGIIVICPWVVPSALASPGKNIAMGRPYTATPMLGGYPAVSNGQEYRKLTDGKFASDPMWEDSENTVGWRLGRQPITLTVDLGESQPISGVSLSSAAGLALTDKEIFGWPGLIDVFVSEDNKQWRPVGELTAMNDRENPPLPAFGKYARHNISTYSLQENARYVRFVFSARREVFLDEVEIYGGKFASGQPSSTPLVKSSDIEKSVKRADPSLEVAQRRYRMDIGTLRERLKDLPKTVSEPIAARLDDLATEVENLKIVPTDKRGILPVGEIGREILAQQAAIWRAQDRPSLHVWQSPLWDSLEWLVNPPKNSEPKIRWDLMESENRAASFNLTNSTDAEQTYFLNFTGLPASGDLTVHSVEWTETSLRTAVASALPVVPKQDHGYPITVPAGMTRQVWLNLYGPGTHGEFSGKMNISQSNTSLGLQMVPISGRVYPFAMPKEQSLHVGGWDYLWHANAPGYGFTKENLSEGLRLLQEYLVDLPWASRGVMPYGKFDSENRYAAKSDQPSTNNFDIWVTELWPKAHTYNIILSVRSKTGGAEIGGCEFAKDPNGFQERINTWLGFWKDHLKTLDLPTNKVALLLIDEPGLSESNPYKDDAEIRTWAEAIRKSNTGFKLFLTPVYNDPRGADQAMLDTMDQLCVKFSRLLNFGPEVIEFYRKRGEKQELFLYECYPTPGGFDPYSYFRMQGWMAWLMNAKGTSFWAFGDFGKENPLRSSWNLGLTQFPFTPLFIDPKSVVAGKPLAAIRESVGDYQTLVYLRVAIAKAKINGGSSEKISSAEKLLREAPYRVIYQNGTVDIPRWIWNKPLNRSVADQVRVEMLQTIADLQTTTNQTKN